MKKTLVIYTFNYFNESVYTFIKHGIFEDENIHFLFVCNNLDISKDIHVDAIFPKYVKVMIRDNIGFDFGGWSVGALTDNLYKNYNYLLFLNSSVLGPYLAEGCKEKWPNIFISKLNEHVKLVGATINTMNDIAHRAHVQSYCFCIDKDTFQYLVDKEMFSLTKFKDDRTDCIYDNEIGMSRLIIDAGYNISCLCPKFDDIDYRFINYPPSHYDGRILYADPPHPWHYNTQWKSTDLIFIKRNRGYNLTEQDKKILSICEI